MCALRGVRLCGIAARGNAAQTLRTRTKPAPDTGTAQDVDGSRREQTLRSDRGCGGLSRPGCRRGAGPGRSFGRMRGRVAAGARQGAAGFAGTNAASRRHTVAHTERLPSRVPSLDGSRAVGGAHGGSFDPLAHKRHGCWAPARTRAGSFPIMQCYAKKPALLASAGWCSRLCGMEPAGGSRGALCITSTL